MLERHACEDHGVDRPRILAPELEHLPDRAVRRRHRLEQRLDVGSVKVTPAGYVILERGNRPGNGLVLRHLDIVRARMGLGIDVVRMNVRTRLHSDRLTHPLPDTGPWPETFAVLASGMTTVAPHASAQG